MTTIKVPASIDASGRTDVSAAMDPTRVPAVIANIPAQKVAAVGSELARRREWVVMGGFVSVVSPAALTASVAVLDGEQLLRIGFVLEDLTRLDEIARMVSDEKLDEMLAAAASHALWDELDELLANLSGEESERIAARYAQAGPDIVAAVEAAAEDGSLSTASALKLAPP